MRDQAAGALGNLAANSGNAIRIAAAGAIPPFVTLLNSSCEAVQVQAAWVLGNLGYHGNGDNCVRIEAAGAFPILQQLTLSRSKVLREKAEWASCSCSTALMIHYMSQKRDETAHAQAVSVVPVGLTPVPKTGDSKEGQEVDREADEENGVVLFSPLTEPATAAATQLQQQEPPTKRDTKLKKQHCCICGATGVPLKKCSRCAVATYCGAICQKAGWKVHKGVCLELRAAAAAVQQHQDRV